MIKRDGHGAAPVLANKACLTSPELSCKKTQSLIIRGRGTRTIAPKKGIKWSNPAITPQSSGLGMLRKNMATPIATPKKTLVGIGVVTLVAAVTLDGLSAILLVPATYLVLNLLEEYVVVPFVIGHRLLLNPVVLFVWLIFWGWLWGVPGALMAVPLLAIVKIVCDHVQPLASLAEFIGQ